MTVTQLTRSPFPETPVSPRHSTRSPRQNLAPGMLVLFVYLLTAAFMLVLPLVGAGLARTLTVSAAVALLVGAVFVAATYEGER